VTGNFIYLVTIWIIPVLIAIIFHEAAHGFVAHLLGDDTARRLGRVSFNPLKAASESAVAHAQFSEPKSSL
jgi:Zn-dependent protease